MNNFQSFDANPSVHFGRYQTKPKADPNHSTVKAARHLKKSLLKINLTVARVDMTVDEVIEAEGVVHHYDNEDAGHRVLEFDLQMELKMGLKLQDSGKFYVGRIFFDLTDNMNEFQPKIHHIIWPQTGGPKGNDMTQCEGVLKSCRTRAAFRALIDEFKADFVNYESFQLVAGVDNEVDSSSDGSSEASIDTDTDSQATPRLPSRGLMDKGAKSIRSDVEAQSAQSNRGNTPALQSSKVRGL
jgi:hypothetical protein